MERLNGLILSLGTITEEIVPDEVEAAVLKKIRAYIS